MFKVIAINTDNKPNDIPNNKCIVKDEVYTVIKMDYMNIQNRILGFQLEEIDLTDCFPYQYFAAKRFRAYTEQDAKIEKAVNELLETKILEI